MRLIFKILIGMILFNAFLFLFSSPNFFNLTETDYGGEIDREDSGVTSYQFVGGDFFSIFKNIFFTAGTILLIGVIAAIVGRSYIIFGAAIVAAIIGGLWAGAFTYVGAIFEPFSYADYLYNILFIITGVIAFIAIAEIFTGRTGDD